MHPSPLPPPVHIGKEFIFPPPSWWTALPPYPSPAPASSNPFPSGPSLHTGPPPPPPNKHIYYLGVQEHIIIIGDPSAANMSDWLPIGD